MTRQSALEAARKADRALELREKGLGRQEIAELLCVKPTNVAGMLQRARQRRKKRAEKVG